MAYIVTNSRGQIIAVVDDGTVNITSTSQTLVGKNVTPYGEYEVENLVHQLENFANSTPPGHPIDGQLWWDTGTDNLYVYANTSWKNVKGLTVSATIPTVNVVAGDLWFNPTSHLVSVYGPTQSGNGWIPINLVAVSASQPTGTIAGQTYYNSSTGQLYLYNGTAWALVGPEGVVGFATTRWTSTTLPDTGFTNHAVMQGEVDGTTIAIISKDTFTILPASAPTGFANLVPGINLSSSATLNGVAASANKLATARTINGVPFDGTTNINVYNTGELIAGTGLIGDNYSGSITKTWAVDGTSLAQSNKVVVRDSNGSFSANVVTANVVGSVSGTALNVTGVVTPAHGGTGKTSYGTGQILIGNELGGLTAGEVTGTSPIVVTSTGNSITIGYVGGTGSGSVVSVGIQAGPGIGTANSPVTSSGSIYVENTGVIRVTGGDGVSVDRSNGNVTITNTGVTRLNANVGLSATNSNGIVTINNVGVTKIIAGDNISISPSGGTGQVTISASGGGGAGYTLPTASSSVLGGVKVGAGLTINSGVLNSSVAGIVAGNNVSIVNNSGVFTINAITSGGNGYVLPTATGSVLGGIKVGAGLAIANGVLSTTSGGGSGTVYSVTAGNGLTGGTITTAGTLALDNSVIRTTGAQTMTGLKQFTGGVISQAYNFTASGSSIFYADPGNAGYQEPVVQIPVNTGSAPYDYAHQFYNQRFVVEGSADPTTPGSNRPSGAAIIGIDNGVTGGGGVFGWHTNNVAGLGIGTGALATNMTFTGAVFQGTSARPSSGDFVQIRSYSQNDVVFEVRGNGNIYYAGSVTGPGSDYAEYFEWADGNAGNEDRVGYTVSLVNNKIKIAEGGDNIIGVVSAVPAVLGDGAELNWKDMYVRDVWGRVVTEEYVAYNWTDKDGLKHSVASYDDLTNVPAHAEVSRVDGFGRPLTRPKINSAYNKDLTYVPRSQRQEWAPIGLMGKLRVRKGQVMGAGWIKLRDINDSIEEWLVK
jgi:Peptidase_G2, IMC autoproteolytic cleavage domain